MSGGTGGGATGANLLRCTVVENTSGTHGGGHSSGTVEQSILMHNHAGSIGGGGWGGTLVNCLIVHNTADRYAGHGGSSLQNCTIADNISDSNSDGVYSATVVNSIIWNNRHGENLILRNYGVSTIDFTCTYPMPDTGEGNITNNPLFAAGGEHPYKLSKDSPCIDAGTDLAAITVDLLGIARPQDGTGDGNAAYDMGCYEYIPPVPLGTVILAR